MADGHAAQEQHGWIWSGAVKAVFVTPYTQDGRTDPAWVGYKSVGALLAGCLEREGIELLYAGGFREAGKLWRGAKQALRNLGGGRRYLRFAEPAILRGYARQLEHRVRGLDVECVISHGWLPVAHADLRVPLVIHNDAPLVRLIDYYSYYSGITDATIAGICRAEQQAIEKAALVVYASEWAAEGAREAYPACADKIHVLPYGPALPGHLIPGDIDSAPRSAQPQCELLFLGVDWERKRGPLAVDIVRRLNQSGTPARLTIAGCSPQIDSGDASWVEIHGFLDTRTERGAQQLRTIMNRSHILLLPVQAEAFGLVFAEASAFGIPSFATATGGVTTAIRDHVNGRLFADSDGADEYCKAIKELMSGNNYGTLARSSRRDYEERLNWRCIGQQWSELLRTHTTAYPKA